MNKPVTKRNKQKPQNEHYNAPMNQDHVLHPIQMGREDAI